MSDEDLREIRAEADRLGAGGRDVSERERQVEDARLDELIEELKQAAWVGDNAAGRVVAAEDALHAYIAELRAVPPAGERAPDGAWVREYRRLRGAFASSVVALQKEAATPEERELLLREYAVAFAELDAHVLGSPAAQPEADVPDEQQERTQP